MKASVLLLTYNQEKFVADALISILKQDYENLEIIVSDDNSQDQTWQIIQDITSNHSKKDQIILNKNTENLGVVGNYYKAFNLSSGDLIFTAAGDDISLPNRCSSCIDFWMKNGEPALIAADGFDMSIDGITLGIKKTDSLEKWDLKMWLKERPFFFGASHMMSRKLLNINKLDSNLHYEDQCLVFRAIALRSATRLALPLVKHRRGGVSQPLIQKFELKKRRLIKGVKHGLHELSQILEDSEIIGVAEIIRPAHLRKINEYRYALEILNSKSLIHQIRLFLENNSIRLDKRIRYIYHSSLPNLMQFFETFKKKLRQKLSRSNKL